MPFLTPLMLLGALAAAIPIAIHLFFRSRYRTVPWAAMKFLLTSVEQTSRRLKFQEYLLLLSRIAVLVFFALAMARPANLTGIGAAYLVGIFLFSIVVLTWVLAPLWQVASSRAANFLVFLVTQVGLLALGIAGWLLFFFVLPVTTEIHARGQGDAVDAVFVFDTSYSMGAIDGAKTRIQRAREEAMRIIDELPPHSTVQIVTCAGQTKDEIGPRSPANLDQARELVNSLELTHLATDLTVGVVAAKDVLQRGQASNKELYVFSDMQKLGFEQQAGALRSLLTEVKKKAVVHFVRCGTREVKNLAIVGIVPQTGVPRPKERVGFAVLVKNTGSEPIENAQVTLAADGDEKNLEPQTVPKLNPQDTIAVTLSARFEKPGPRVLTAKILHDDMEGDNRYDQVIVVRDQVNILVVDGKQNPDEPERSSSFHLMHSLLPVTDVSRASYKYNPVMVPARLASPARLANQDICILVNCAMPEAGLRTEALASDFLDALGTFVRKGHGLIVISGDHVKPAVYNKVLGEKLGLLPLALKPIVKAKENEPLHIVRKSFGDGPPAYWNFSTDRLYKSFDLVEVWRHVGLDETTTPKWNTPANGDKADDELANVIVRLDSGKPLAVSRRVDSGEVIFFATAAHDEGFDPKSLDPYWTNINRLPPLLMFLDVSIGHLMHGQTQTYNLVAGQTLQWFPKDRQDNAYYLVHPGGKQVDRLGLPEKRDKRVVVTARDLPRAGIYTMVAQPRDGDSSAALDPREAAKKGMPIAVIPDLSESADLTALTDGQIDEALGFRPIHMIAGETGSVSSGADRINREWTMWALLAVMGLVLFEVAFAWWCGRAW